MPTKAEQLAYQPRTNTSDASWLKSSPGWNQCGKGFGQTYQLEVKTDFSTKKHQRKLSDPTYIRPFFFCLGCPNLRPLVALQKQKCLPRRFSETPLIWWTCWSFRRQIVSDELKYGVPFQGGRKHLPPNRKARKIIGLDSKKVPF